MNMLTKRWLSRGLLFGSILGTGILLASCGVLPAAFSYQGRLLTSSGAPVADGNYTFTFKLWDASSAGTLECTDSATLSVQDGLFDAIIDACEVEVFREPLYLEVTVDDSGANPPETLSPRQQLRGVPYANSLAGGAVVQAFEPINRTLDGNADTGAALAVFNSDITNLGGHGLLVGNSADMSAAGGYNSGDSAALAAKAQGDGYGAIITSAGYRGMYVDGDSDAAAGTGIWYDAFFAGDVGIFVNGACTGCRLSYIGKNDGSVAIRPGDLLVPTGVVEDPELGTPVMLVRAASSADDPIVGVAERAMTRSEVRNKNGWTTGGYDGAEGDIPPGGYLSIVVDGLVQVRASRLSDLSIGARATVAGDGAIGAGPAQSSLGTIMSAADSDGLVWILLRGR